MAWCKTAITLLLGLMYLMMLADTLALAADQPLRFFFDLIWMAGIAPAFAIWLGAFVFRDALWVAVVALAMATVVKSAFWDPFISTFPAPGL